MRRKSEPDKAPAEQVIKDIRRATRRHFSAEDKIRIVLEGIRGETGCARGHGPHSAGAKASPPTSITPGAKSSSMPARSAWSAIPNARPIRAMCLSCAAR